MSPLDKIEVEVSAVVGGRAMRLGDVLRLQQGALIALDSESSGRITLMIGEHRVGCGRLANEEAGARRVVMGGASPAASGQQ